MLLLKQQYQCGKEEETPATITKDMKHAFNDDNPDAYYYEMEAEEQKQWKLESIRKLEEEYEEDPELKEEDEDNEYESFDYDDLHLAYSGEKPPNKRLALPWIGPSTAITLRDTPYDCVGIDGFYYIDIWVNYTARPTAQNSNNLTNAMSVYIERKINDDLYFAAGLSHLWEIRMIPVRSAGLRIAFDPTKSPHYKLMDVGRTFCDIDIQTYSSETGKWNLYRNRFNYFSFDHFDSAIYWNDGLHWLETDNRHLIHYNLNIEDPDHPIITTIPIPQRGMTFLKSYGYMDQMQILIQMSHLLHLEGKLFEWRRSLFLFCLDDFGSSEFTIYEMMIGCFVWTVRYRVYTDDFMTPFPKGWSIWSNVWSIVLGEREQDSFLVMNLSGKVVQYNLISKTLHEIYGCVFNQLDDNHDDNDDDNDELLQQF
ncbi:hypothetical protein Tco_0053720 [Tanacetum coccineum]